MSLDWLLSGKGSKYPSNIDNPPLPSNDNFIYIPRYEVLASAGAGAFNETELIKEYLPFKKEWFTKYDVSAKDSSIITVSGDSMSPTINDSDIILIDHSKKNSKTSGIYVLIYQQDTLVKRLDFQLNGSIEIISDNKLYKPQIIPAERTNDLIIAGRVRWVGHNMG